METIQSTGKAAQNQVVTQGKSSKASAEFDSTLRSFLVPDAANKVSEEDLFAALVQQRIQKMKGEEGLKDYQDILASSRQAFRRPDGYIPPEAPAKDALTKFQAAGKLTTEEANSIYSEAFSAAQLDGNTESLYDSKGSRNDPTIAIELIDEAILSTRLKIEKFDSGVEKAPSRNFRETTTSEKPGVTIPGKETSDGFLFKPVSDKDGKLVVLLPPRMAGIVSSVRLIGPNGEAIENGRFTSNSNGGRDHFRFNKSGGQYPDKLTVEVTLTNSDVIRYAIDETSERSDGKESGRKPEDKDGNNDSPKPPKEVPQPL